MRKIPEKEEEPITSPENKELTGAKEEELASWQDLSFALEVED